MWIVPGLVDDSNVSQSIEFFKELYKIASTNDKRYFDTYIDKGDNLLVKEGFRQGKEELEKIANVKMLDNELRYWYNNGKDITDINYISYLYNYVKSYENIEPFKYESSDEAEANIRKFLISFPVDICKEWYSIILNWMPRAKYSKLKPSESVFLNSDLARKDIIEKGLGKILDSNKPINWRSL